MLGKSGWQEQGARSDRQHHQSEDESRHARLRVPTSWEEVAIGGNTSSDGSEGQRDPTEAIPNSRIPLG